MNLFCRDDRCERSQREMNARQTVQDWDVRMRRARTETETQTTKENYREEQRTVLQPGQIRLQRDDTRHVIRGGKVVIRTIVGPFLLEKSSFGTGRVGRSACSTGRYGWHRFCRGEHRLFIGIVDHNACQKRRGVVHLENLCGWWMCVS
jgi:hypothetical protein